MACETCTCTFRLFLIPIHIAVHVQSLQAGDAVPRPGVRVSRVGDAVPRPGVRVSRVGDAVPRPGVRVSRVGDAVPRPGDGAALVEAAAEGDVDVVASLLERGADVNSSKDEEGRTPLVAGCGSGSTELVKLLIERGAHVNMRADITTEEGSGFITPLCMALMEGHDEVAALLIEHGADVNAVGVEGKVGEVTGSLTPLMLAAGEGLQHATKLLLERGAEVDKETERSGGGESKSVTVLMLADTAEVATLLLDHGAQVDFQASHGGHTALMWAIEEGHYEVAELLPECGAQVDLQDSDGRTALMWAVKKHEANTVRLLIQHKASIDIQTKRGETALDLARENSLTDIAELLTSPTTALAVETPAESESVAYKTTPPEPYDLMMTLTSMFQAKIDTLTNRMDNFDSRLTRVESTGAISNNPAPQQEEDPAPPDLAEAHRILKPLAHEWENIGMYLRIPEHEIEVIKIEERGVLRNCLRELLKVWLRGVATPPSWWALAEAVGEVDGRVAREITDRHTR